MRRANVVMIDNNDLLRTVMRLQIEGAGHTVTAEATDQQSALLLINEIAIGRIACDVITLDGNLDDPAESCSDAFNIATYAREQQLGAYILGVSNFPLAERGVPVDQDLTKSHISELAATISNLTLPDLSHAA